MSVTLSLKAAPALFPRGTFMALSLPPLAIFIPVAVKGFYVRSAAYYARVLFRRKKPL